MKIERRRLLLATAAVAVTNIQQIIIKKKNSKNKKKFSRKWLLRRNEGRGILHMLNEELRVEDPLAYRNFLRLTSAQFDVLLAKLEPYIKKEDTNMRESISARCRLEVTLRFLATGESYRSLMYSTRIHETTISKFVPEVCEAICTHLKHDYLKTPTSVDEWLEISRNFNEMWQFPHCLGALDGRHINFRAPRSDGSYYYNYKNAHSIVLLAVADATYKFVYANIGCNGRISDGGVFRASGLSKAIIDNRLNFPSASPLPGRTEHIPYVIIADDAFPLSNRLMKPYPQRGLAHEMRIFNYRLSRARRIIENAFGILANRFRILLNPISLSAQKVETITLACVILHNFLATHNYVSYTDITAEEIAQNSLKKVCRQPGNRCTKSALLIREEFKNFFSSHSGSVPWQETAILKSNM